MIRTKDHYDDDLYPFFLASVLIHRAQEIRFGRLQECLDPGIHGDMAYRLMQTQSLLMWKSAANENEGKIMEKLMIKKFHGMAREQIILKAFQPLKLDDFKYSVNIVNTLNDF